MKIALRICVAITTATILCTGCSTNLNLSTASSRTSPQTTEFALPSTSEEATAAIETTAPVPSAMPTASAASSPVRINEDNLLQYFQFGMSYDEVENRLSELNIPFTSDCNSVNHPVGWWSIIANNSAFYCDASNRLYSVSVLDNTGKSGWKTAKGLQTGDSVDRMHLLYGKEDEFDARHNEYIYYRNGFLLSIGIGDDNTVDWWKFFVNIWNRPFESASTPPLGEGNSAAFDEDNFMVNFPFGMGHKAVEMKLTELGMRITSVIYDSPNDDGFWEIDTDHATFTLDGDTDRLNVIEVTGWDTARGLKAGDPPERLRQLYGKKYRFDKKFGGYAFHKKGYWFCVDFNQEIEGMSSWWVSAG